MYMYICICIWSKINWRTIKEGYYFENLEEDEPVWQIKEHAMRK
jgi:hypothetical protein